MGIGCGQDKKIIRHKCETDGCTSDVIEENEGTYGICYNGQDDWPPSIPTM